MIAIIPAKKYSSRSEWKNKSVSAYSACLRLKLLDKATGHMKILNPKGKWSKKISVIQDAKKYSTKLTWMKNSSGAYEAAKNNNWFDDATAHMKVLRKRWTKEEIIIDAKKYTTKVQWRNASSGARMAARRLNCFEEATAHMN